MGHLLHYIYIQCLCCRYLGHLYVSEALVSQCRIGEALQHLSPENVTDVSWATPGSEGGELRAGCSCVWADCWCASREE